MQMAAATKNDSSVNQIQSLKNLVILDQKTRNMNNHNKKMQSEEIKHLTDVNVTSAVKFVAKALPPFDGDGWKSASDSMQHWLKELKRTDSDAVNAKYTKLSEVPGRVEKYAQQLAAAALRQAAENKEAFESVPKLDPGSAESEAARNI